MVITGNKSSNQNPCLDYRFIFDDFTPDHDYIVGYFANTFYPRRLYIGFWGKKGNSGLTPNSYSMMTELNIPVIYSLQQCNVKKDILYRF